MELNMQNTQYLKLSESIQTELVNYINFFKITDPAAPPILAFPADLGPIICKTIRYFAAIYDLAAFYVYSRGPRLLAVCHKEYLNNHYRNFYNHLFIFPNEDAEMVNGLKLQSSMIRSNSTLSNFNLHSELGLPTDIPFTMSDLGIEEDSLEFKTVENNLTKPSESLKENLQTYASVTKDSSKETAAISKLGKEFAELHVNPPKENVCGASQGATRKPNSALKKCATGTIPKNKDEKKSSVLLAPSTSDERPKINSTKVTKNLALQLQQSKLEYLTIDMLKLYFEYTEGLLKYLTLPPLIVSANEDYSIYQYIQQTNMDNVIEVYDIPTYFRTANLLEIFAVRPSRIKWCDESHALIITTNRDDAQTLLEITSLECKTRAMINGSPVATIIASLIDFPSIVSTMLDL